MRSIHIVNRCWPTSSATSRGGARGTLCATPRRGSATLLIPEGAKATEGFDHPARDCAISESVLWATTPRVRSMTSLAGGTSEHASPTKRKAAGEVVDVEEGEKLSLEAIKATFAAELRGHQEVMKDHQDVMKEDIHKAVGGVKKEMAERISLVESEVTQQLQTTLLLLKQLTDKQEVQSGKMAALVAGQKTLEETVESNRRTLEERIEKLEAGGGGLRPSTYSTATTEGDGIGGRRTPALVVGGWNDDTPANEVIEKATEVLRQLQVDLDYQDIFVPGIRRGFALIPLKGPREGEGGEEHRRRVQTAITQVRNAKLQTGHYRQDTGQPRYMYLTISQPPERRMRAKLAAKVKRCILELGGRHEHLEVEFATGTVWYRGTRVSSAVSPANEGADKVGPGWANVKEIAKVLKIDFDKADHQWRPAVKRWQTKVSHPGRGANRPARTASADLECWGSRGNKDPRHPPNHLPGGRNTRKPWPGGCGDPPRGDLRTWHSCGEFKRLDPRHGEASFGVER